MSSVNLELVKRLGATPFSLSVYPNGFHGGGAYVIPAGNLSSCTIRRGRNDPTAQPNAATLSTVLVNDGHAHNLSEGVQLRLSNDALDIIFGSHTSDDALAARARFTGNLADADSQVKPTTQQKAYDVNYAGLLARYARGKSRMLETFIPFGPLPDGYGLTGISQIVETMTNCTDPIAVGPYSTVEEQTFPMFLRSGGTTKTVVAWDEQATSTQLMQAISDMFQAVIIEQRDGRFDWLEPTQRRGETALTIANDWIVSPVADSVSADGLITTAEVGYGDASDSRSVASPLVETLGEYPASLSTKLKFAADAKSLAADIVSRHHSAGWVIPTLTIDLLRLIDAGQWTLLRGLLLMETERLIDVTGIPADPDVESGPRYVIGVTEIASRERWQMQLSCVPYEVLGPPLRWYDVPSSVHWDDVPANRSWYDSTTDLGV